jgi:hypothetical protein
LINDTNWTLDHLYLAQLLKAIRNSHPDPGKIDDELRDPGQWWKDLDRWERELVMRNAEISANAHRRLIQLTDWLSGPGHVAIDTAILKDTNADSPQDAIDVARGVLHWAVCTEHMVALEPGVAYLRDLFNKPGSVPSDIVFSNLALDATAVKIPKTQVKAFRYAGQGALMLLSLKDFLAPPPGLNSNGTRDDFLLKLGAYEDARRTKLIQLLNDSRIFPTKIIVPAISVPSSLPNKKQVAATALNSLLDAADKWTSWVIDPDLHIPRKFGLNWMANLEEWFKKRPTFAKFVNVGTSYALKGVALALNGYNLYHVLTTARFDYQTQQMTVTKLNYAQAISGATLAVQDVLSEVGVLLKSQTMQRLFPQLVTSMGGRMAAARVTGIVGQVYARINFVAMIVSGITTMISMYQSRGKALASGDYTAAKFYTVGVVGGAFMVAGGIAFGLAVCEVGGAFFATGPGALVGVVLFLVGGIIATVASIIGWWKSTYDEYQIFARKCFLGTQGDLEPRFDDDPPDWSHALAKGSDTWPLDKQKRALHNLLGRFVVKTNLEPPYKRESYNGRIKYDIKPGVFMPGSMLEIAMGYGTDGTGQQASVTIEWDPDAPPGQDYKTVKSTANSLFDASNIDLSFMMTDTTISKISVWANSVNYDSEYGELVTVVTVTYPNLPNVIRTRKLVIGVSGHDIYEDTDEVVSGLFV